MKSKIFFRVLTAAVLWFAMFSPWTAPYLNFWYAMSCSAIILWLISARLTPDFLRSFHVGYKDLAIGVSSAVVLWGVFFIGDVVSSWMFNFAAPQVSDIYSMKDNQDILFISLALILVIGPAEEVFWRGYLQRMLTVKYGKYAAFVSTTLIYALVHVWSFNFMLIMAALVCGFFWGVLYMYRRSLMTNIISHALWDVAVFIIFPIGQ